jgi:O-antigen ligase
MSERPALAIHPIVVVALCVCLASFPFEFPLRTFRWEVPTMTTSLFLLTTLFQPRACYFSYIPGSIWWLGAYLYACALALSLKGFVSLPDTAQETILFIQALLFFWACANLLRHDGVARAALWSFVIACVVRAALPFMGIGRTGETVWTGGERITAFGQNANWSAKLLATAVVALVGLMYVHPRAPHRFRWLALAAIAGLGVAIVDTGSRGGLLALAVGLLAFAVGPSSGRSAWATVRNGLIGVASIAFLAFAAMRTEVMRNRFADTAETGNMAGREVLFPTLWGMFLERPWTGWGVANQRFELADRIAERNRLQRDTHNLVLETLTTAGILGTIPFFVALGLVVRGAWRARRGFHGIAPAALLAMHLVGAMSGNPITSKLFWLVCAYCLGAAVPLVRQARAPLRSRATVPMPMARA